MKTRNILNIIAFLFAVLGAIFRHQHWPGGKILIVASLLILIFVLFQISAKQSEKRTLFLAVAGILFFFILTLIFKMMHWPGAAIFSIGSTILVLVISGVLTFVKEDIVFPKQHLLTFFIFLLILDALLHNTGWSKLPAFKSSEDQVCVAVTPTKMNVIYFGIDNPLSVVIAGLDYKNLEVKSDNGSVVSENGNYIVHPEKAEVPANISLCADGKIIGTTTFRVKLIPDPVAELAGMSNGILDKALLLDQKGIQVVLPNFDFDLKFKITEFTILVTKNGMTSEVVSHSDQFTTDQLGLFQKLEPGQKFSIEEIKAFGPDGRERILKPMVFVVK